MVVSWFLLFRFLLFQFFLLCFPNAMQMTLIRVAWGTPAAAAAAALALVHCPFDIFLFPFVRSLFICKWPKLWRKKKQTGEMMTKWKQRAEKQQKVAFHSLSLWSVVCCPGSGGGWRKREFWVSSFVFYLFCSEWKTERKRMAAAAASIASVILLVLVGR